MKAERLKATLGSRYRMNDPKDPDEDLGNNQRNEDEEGNQKMTIDAKTLLQVDATVIVGVLFFLTLTSFVKLSSDEISRVYVAAIEIVVVFPFGMSAIIIVVLDYRLRLRRLSSILAKGPIHGLKLQKTSFYRKIGQLFRGAEFFTFRRAESFTIIGFAYLLFALLTLYIVANANINTKSTEEKCAEAPSQFGVNKTHLWHCSMFSEGSLANKCVMNPHRFGLNTSDCSKFITPSGNEIHTVPTS